MCAKILQNIPTIFIYILNLKCLAIFLWDLVVPLKNNNNNNNKTKNKNDNEKNNDNYSNKYSVLLSILRFE